MTLELGLSLWGAGLATALAVIKIKEHLQQRARIRVTVTFVRNRYQEGENAIGVPVVAPGLGTEHLALEVEVENRGGENLEIKGVVFVGRDHEKTLVIGGGVFPCVLEPHSSKVATVQKDFLDSESMIAMGVLDAHRQFHMISPACFDGLLQDSLGSHTAVKKQINPTTGALETFFQAQDEMKYRVLRLPPAWRTSWLLLSRLRDRSRLRKGIVRR